MNLARTAVANLAGLSRPEFGERTRLLQVETLTKRGAELDSRLNGAGEDERPFEPAVIERPPPTRRRERLCNGCEAKGAGFLKVELLPRSVVKSADLTPTNLLPQTARAHLRFFSALAPI